MSGGWNEINKSWVTFDRMLSMQIHVNAITKNYIARIRRRPIEEYKIM